MKSLFNWNAVVSTFMHAESATIILNDNQLQATPLRYFFQAWLQESAQFTPKNNLKAKQNYMKSLQLIDAFSALRLYEIESARGTKPTWGTRFLLLRGAIFQQLMWGYDLVNCTDDVREIVEQNFQDCLTCIRQHQKLFLRQPLVLLALIFFQKSEGNNKKHYYSDLITVLIDGLYNSATPQIYFQLLFYVANHHLSVELSCKTSRWRVLETLCIHSIYLNKLIERWVLDINFLRSSQKDNQLFSTHRQFILTGHYLLQSLGPLQRKSSTFGLACKNTLILFEGVFSCFNKFQVVSHKILWVSALAWYYYQWKVDLAKAEELLSSKIGGVALIESLSHHYTVNQYLLLKKCTFSKEPKAFTSKFLNQIRTEFSKIISQTSHEERAKQIILIYYLGETYEAEEKHLDTALKYYARLIDVASELGPKITPQLYSLYRQAIRRLKNHNMYQPQFRKNIRPIFQLHASCPTQYLNPNIIGRGNQIVSQSESDLLLVEEKDLKDQNIVDRTHEGYTSHVILRGCQPALRRVFPLLDATQYKQMRARCQRIMRHKGPGFNKIVAQMISRIVADNETPEVLQQRHIREIRRRDSQLMDADRPSEARYLLSIFSKRPMFTLEEALRLQEFDMNKKLLVISDLVVLLIESEKNNLYPINLNTRTLDIGAMEIFEFMYNNDEMETPPEWRGNIKTVPNQKSTIYCLGMVLFKVFLSREKSSWFKDEQGNLKIKKRQDDLGAVSKLVQMMTWASPTKRLSLQKAKEQILALYLGY